MGREILSGKAKIIWSASFTRSRSRVTCKWCSFSYLFRSFQIVVRAKIGEILCNTLDPDDFEESLFQVVSLCNCSASTASKTERKNLVKMNLRAALKVSCCYFWMYATLILCHLSHCFIILYLHRPMTTQHMVLQWCTFKRAVKCLATKVGK